MQLKQFYNIATKVSSRKNATPFGDLPDCSIDFCSRVNYVLDKRQLYWLRNSLFDIYIWSEFLDIEIENSWYTKTSDSYSKIASHICQREK